LRALVYRTVADIARNGVTGRELQKVQNRVRAAYVTQLETNLHRATRLAEFEMYDGNAALVRTELDRYAAVRADDIRRVAAQYLTTANRTVLDVVPAGHAGSGGSRAAPASGSTGSSAAPGGGR
jgi:predicted Zn-dependent peptidase